MAASVSDQVQAVLDFEHWKQDRGGKYVDTSAGAYAEWLVEREELERLQRVRLFVVNLAPDDFATPEAATSEIATLHILLGGGE